MFDPCKCILPTNLTLFFYLCILTLVVIDFLIAQALHDYLESAGSEPFPFPSATDTIVMEREFICHYHRYYGYLNDWLLAEIIYPDEWVVK